MPIGGAGGRSTSRPRPTGWTPSIFSPTSLNSRGSFRAAAPRSERSSRTSPLPTDPRPRLGMAAKSSGPAAAPAIRRAQGVALSKGWQREHLRPMPQSPRHLLVRWDALLGKVAIPFRPRSVLDVSEVESIDDVSALPAAVGRRDANGPRRHAVGPVSHSDRERSWDRRRVPRARWPPDPRAR